MAGVTADVAADITIEAGLSPDTGFVLDPGRTVVADIFGAGRYPVDCEAM